jgi:hypothetical protein
VVTGGAANLLAAQVPEALEVLAAVNAGELEVSFHTLSCCCLEGLLPSIESCEIRERKVSIGFWILDF